MEQQLALTGVEQRPAPAEARGDWHLDARTRELGRRGVEQARQALREAIRKAAA